MTRRLPVPDDIIERVHFGNQNPAAVFGRFWRAVEERMRAYVLAHLPPGASEVCLALDEERCEVLLSYRAPPGRRC